jgi:hypothetical protein
VLALICGRAAVQKNRSGVASLASEPFPEPGFASDAQYGCNVRPLSVQPHAAAQCCRHTIDEPVVGRPPRNACVVLYIFEDGGELCFDACGSVGGEERVGWA